MPADSVYDGDPKARLKAGFSASGPPTAFLTAIYSKSRFAD
jgi:hypothetical protein